MRIKFEFAIDSENDEPNRYVTLYSGQIFDYGEDNEGCDEPDVKVGEVDLFMISRGRILDDHESLFDAMDDVSSDTMACYEAIINQKTDDWKNQVRTISGEDRMISWDIMLIKRLELGKEFRGKGLGKRAALEVVKTIGANCAVIVCKPFPLQYTGSGDAERTEERAAPGYEKKRRAAFRKVTLFWKDVGFAKIPSSDHYVWANDNFLADELE